METAGISRCPTYVQNQMSCYLYNILGFLEKKLSIQRGQCTRFYFIERGGGYYKIYFLFLTFFSAQQVVLCRYGHFFFFVTGMCFTEGLSCEIECTGFITASVICVYKSHTWLINSFVKWEINNNSNQLTSQSRDLPAKLTAPQVVKKIMAIY